MATPNPRCLLICHQQLGDLTLLEPAIARIGAAYGTPVEVHTRSGHGPLVSLIPDARQVLRPWLTAYEAVFCYGEQPKSALHALPIRCRRKALLLHHREEIRPLHRWVFRELRAPGLDGGYVARYHWENTLAGEAAEFRAPTLLQPPGDWRPASAPESDFLLLNATAGWASKMWKPRHWVSVLKSLQGAGLPPVVITCGTEDWQLEHARAIADAVGDYAKFLGGQTTLEAYLWLVAKARMVLGIDGSASHLKAAFGGKNLVLFLRTSAANWHWPTPISVALCGQKMAGSKNPQIDPELVLETALNLWRLPAETAVRGDIVRE